MSVKAESTFSLKDHLFNKKKVSMIAEEIFAVYPRFKKKQFVEMVVERFPELELLERLYWIRDCLQQFLPAEYQVAAKILVESLPPPCDPTLSDNDYGDFIYGPYGAFVAEYGSTKKDLPFSFAALKEMTKRFSVEFPIRTFLNDFPKETLTVLKKWAGDENYHVRRLASEGTRPKLPWAKNIVLHYTEPLPILNTLYADSTRYVTRSVANHINDISKIDPTLAIKTLKRWQKERKQTKPEMDFIVQHSLRTLEKQGDQHALSLLGYQKGEIKLENQQIETPKVAIGEALEFSFSIRSTAKQSQKLLIDYHVYFKKANGSATPKTFKITKTTIEPGETLMFSKRQLLRPMTTRALYLGQHEIELQINGTTYKRQSFELVDV